MNVYYYIPGKDKDLDTCLDHFTPVRFSGICVTHYNVMYVSTNVLFIFIPLSSLIERHTNISLPVYPVHTVVCVCVTCGVMRFVPRIHTHTSYIHIYLYTYLLDLRTLRIIRGVYATLLDTPGLPPPPPLET
jgi:hypothetical protein